MEEMGEMGDGRMEGWRDGGLATRCYERAVLWSLCVDCLSALVKLRVGFCEEELHFTELLFLGSDK